MKVTITGRHFDVSDDLRDYTGKKLMKLEKYFKRLIGIRVTMFMEKHMHIIDVVINADGVRFHGNEKADDMYNSVDLVVKSLEKQVSRHKEKVTGHKVVQIAKAAPSAPDISDDGITISINEADQIPKDEIEAYLEMKIDKKDFILFKKHICYGDRIEDTDESYAVIYSGKDGIKMAEIPVQMIREKNYDPENLLEFDVIVTNESVTNPQVDFKKSKKNIFRSMTVVNAMKELAKSNEKFVPFFNSDTKTINVLYKSGNGYSVMTPNS